MYVSRCYKSIHNYKVFLSEMMRLTGLHTRAIEAIALNHNMEREFSSQLPEQTSSKLKSEEESQCRDVM